ncbi:flagellar hook-basal body complex protein FliE [Halomonas huangheensis]|uniref:Flagellar hook-basal body complex protein FliE n=1 Tax=Halomonas huangheensis TaxID=1178482 RepID=W1N5C9_9GAMM|nr:flagellar hook-basal body complex protein FliE [Halomonas huangheensis]ALM54231.1 flagellar hook-basal body protein FliE [Halomonas huangheensis]ERL50777.1 hypothetical protein BJB45_19470 [Halomonas huangheensis]
MATPAMQSALAQMTSLAQQSGAATSLNRPFDRAATKVDGDANFADALESSIQRINELKSAADTKAQAFQAGAPGVELNDVMVDMQKASLSFQMGQQVRDRLVSAYREVMNMQV